MADVEAPEVHNMGESWPWDPYSGEPIAWLTHGDPVAGTLYGGAGPIAYTHLLTVEEAIDAYGPISEWVVGPQGGIPQGVLRVNRVLRRRSRTWLRRQWTT